MVNNNSSVSAEDKINRDLLSRVSAGDRGSFAKLYRRFYTPLTRFAYRYLQMPELVEEVVNDTMMIVWRKAGSFRGDSRVSTWIIGIGMRKCWESQSKLRAKQWVSDENLETADPATSGHDRLDTAQAINWALEHLSADHRATVELAYYIGYTCEEIAHIMGCRTSTVKTRLHYARKALKKVMTAPDIGVDFKQMSGDRYDS